MLSKLFKRALGFIVKVSNKVRSFIKPLSAKVSLVVAAIVHEWPTTKAIVVKADKKH